MFSKTLRPLRVAALPRAAPSRCSRLPSFARCLATQPSSTTESPVVTAQETPAARSQVPRPPQQLPYHIGRNRMNNIAVYEERARGGSLKKTLLKKGEGNLQALRFDVAEALGLTEKEVKVNNITNHIEIKVRQRPRNSSLLSFLPQTHNPAGPQERGSRPVREKYGILKTRARKKKEVKQ